MPQLAGFDTKRQVPKVINPGINTTEESSIEVSSLEGSSMEDSSIEVSSMEGSSMEDSLTEDFGDTFGMIYYLHQIYSRNLL